MPVLVNSENLLLINVNKGSCFIETTTGSNTLIANFQSRDFKTFVTATSHWHVNKTYNFELNLQKDLCNNKQKIRKLEHPVTKKQYMYETVFIVSLIISF